MKKNALISLLSLTTLLILGGCASTIEIGPVPSITPKPTVTPTPSPTPTPVPDNKEREDYMAMYEETGELKSIKERYEGYFDMGIVVSQEELENEKKQALIIQQFNSLTCRSEMMPESILDYEATLASGDLTRAVVNFSKADPILQFAMDNNMTVRSNALISHETPEWFFAADFKKLEVDATAEAEAETIVLASAEVMEARMENYIKDVMEYCNTKYPGVVVVWDVMEEVVLPGDGHDLKYRTSSNWYATMGESYIFKCCEIARKYVAEGQKIFYQEAALHETARRFPTVELVKLLVAQDLIDGLSLQAHYSHNGPNTIEIQDMIGALVPLGVEIDFMEMDVDTRAARDKDMERTEEDVFNGLGKRYKSLFNIFTAGEDKGNHNIGSVTMNCLTDDVTNLNDTPEGEEPKVIEIWYQDICYPAFFDEDLNPKVGFFGALQDKGVKSY